MGNFEACRSGWIVRLGMLEALILDGQGPLIYGGA